MVNLSHFREYLSVFLTANKYSQFELYKTNTFKGYQEVFLTTKKSTGNITYSKNKKNHVSTETYRLIQMKSKIKATTLD